MEPHHRALHKVFRVPRQDAVARFITALDAQSLHLSNGQDPFRWSTLVAPSFDMPDVSDQPSARRLRSGRGRSDVPVIQRPTARSIIAESEEMECQKCAAAFAVRYTFGDLIAGGGKDGVYVSSLATLPAESKRISALLTMAGVHAKRTQLVIKGQHLDFIPEEDYEEFANEITMGYFINLIAVRGLSPNFTFMVDWFRCRDISARTKRPRTCQRNVQYMIFERLDSPLAAHISRFVSSLRGVRAITFQVFAAFQVGWDVMAFMHQDAHLGNIMVTDTGLGDDDKAQDWLFGIDVPRLGRVAYRLPIDHTGGYLVKLFDFGLSRGYVSSSRERPTARDRVTGADGLEDSGVSRNHPTRAYDVRKFIFSLLLEVSPLVWEHLERQSGPDEVRAFRQFAARAMGADLMRNLLQRNWSQFEALLAGPALVVSDELVQERAREHAVLDSFVPAVFDTDEGDNDDSLFVGMIMSHSGDAHSSTIHTAIIGTIKKYMVHRPGGGYLTPGDALAHSYFSSYLEPDPDQADRAMDVRRMSYALSEVMGDRGVLDAGRTLAYGGDTVSAKLAALSVDPTSICASCGTDDPDNECGGCHAVGYCNDECKQSHWVDTHRYVCSGNPPSEVGIICSGPIIPY